MTQDHPHINFALFVHHFQEFKSFVQEKGRLPFHSFASHPYTDGQEGYKYDIYKAAREKLAFEAWQKSDIGSGEIVTATLQAIELSSPKNNLFLWQAKYGEENRPQQPMYEALGSGVGLARIEDCLFRFYHSPKEADLFEELTDIFGKKYPLLSYLLFIKDRSQFLPISPKYMDRAFELLGAEFKTSYQCSWENYSVCLSLINELKGMLAEQLNTEVTLLDAHSFAWILSSQMKEEGKLSDVTELMKEVTTERESTVKTRIGQERFRNDLKSYWSVCAVTGCSKLLTASHIKPWAKSSPSERLDLFNGLLLSPALDQCFDAGYISFGNDGEIMISPQLGDQSREAMGIDLAMKLTKLDDRHREYLDYHREHVFK